MDIKDNLLLLIGMLWILQTLATLIIGVGIFITGIFILFEGDIVPLIIGGISIAVAIIEIIIMLVMIED